MIESKPLRVIRLSVKAILSNLAPLKRFFRSFGEPKVIPLFTSGAPSSKHAGQKIKGARKDTKHSTDAACARPLCRKRLGIPAHDRQHLLRFKSGINGLD
jgi:hypothetical protein